MVHFAHTGADSAHIAELTATSILSEELVLCVQLKSIVWIYALTA